MNNIKVGFIGAGNMGSALARAVALTGAEVSIYDLDAQKCKSVADSISAKAVNLSELVGESDFIFLGVKPQGLGAIASELAPMLEGKNKIIVSMLAGVSTGTLNQTLGARVIRIMPNTSVGIGEGVVLWTTDGSIDEAECKAFETILSRAGVVDRISEDKIDAATAISGCGPAFVYMFIDALAKGGVACGLDYDKSLLYAAQTLIGASKNLIASQKTAEELKNAVCSPNGSTIEGVRSLEANALDRVVGEAVSASYKRTVELGK